MTKLILASTSPRRRELLSRLKLPYEVVAPSYEEKETGLSPEDECRHHAEHKARSVAALYPADRVLGCDTLIACDDEIIGKPKDTADAVRILQKLSGREHRVLSAVFLIDPDNGPKKHLEVVRVVFRSLSQDQIENYVATGEPMGKAGAYAIQGQGRAFIASVDGEEEAVIGLPLIILKKWLLN